MPTTLSTIKLPLHTACLAFCPSSQENWLAVGSYELSACRKIRQGRLHILDVADSHADNLLVVELFSHELPGARGHNRKVDELLLAVSLSILSLRRRL